MFGVVALLAGCLGPSSPSLVVDDGHIEAADSEAAPDTYQNRFLLDFPRPASTTISGGGEPSILADTAGRYLWIGDTSGLYRSEDRGSTWTKMRSPFTTGTCDGWAMAQDAKDRLYVAVTGCVHIEVARSSTHGSTWDALPATGRFLDAAPVADRPWIAARGDGEATVLFYDFGRTLSEMCLRTTDGAQTWMDRYANRGGMNAGNAVYDADGALYYNSGRFVWRYAGSCMDAPTYVDFFPAGIGEQVFTQVDVGPLGIFSAAPSPGNTQIDLVGSRDFKTTKSVRISPPGLVSNTFAAVSTKADQVAVAWYASETAGDPSLRTFQGSWNVFVAVVRDFWSDTPLVEYHRVTTEPNHVGQLCMGGIGCQAEDDRDLLDYFGIDFDDWDTLHVAYGHDGAGTKREVRHAALVPSHGVVVPVVPEQPITGGPTVPGSGSPRPSPSSGNAAPHPTFTTDAQGRTLHVDASKSTDPDGDAIDYEWDWGDGQGGDFGEKQSHLYSTDGQFVVTLTATDAFGASRTVQRQVAIDDGVANLAPNAAFSIDPEQPRPGGEVQFIDSSTDPDGRVVSYHWSFGDGTTSDKRYPRRTFDAGTYSIELKVTDDRGATDSLVQPLVVKTPEEPAQPMAASPSRPPENAPGLGIVAFIAAAVVLATVRRRFG